MNPEKTYYPYSEIKEGKHLANTEKVDHIAMFNLMIQQKWSKMLGNNWEILYQDTNSIYFGFNLFADKGYWVEIIYSVDKAELDSNFPLYSQMEFREISQQIEDSTNNNFSFSDVEIIQYSYNQELYMTEDAIHCNIEFDYKIRNDAQDPFIKREIHHFSSECTFDKKTLHVLSRNTK